MLFMKNRVIYLLMISVTSTLFASMSEIRLGGRFSGWGQVTTYGSNSMNLGGRYIPSMEAEISPQFDTELAGNCYASLSSDYTDEPVYSKQVKPYRMWIRYTTPRFESRLGLQKINFGPAKILRSLMWFDWLDPKDPLQFTEGLYGLRLRYDFQNNANVWIWGLYGNDGPKGWETLPAKNKMPEIGGRVQHPVGNGELAFSTHHRTVNTIGEGTAETRIGLDGMWDIGIGAWFESTLVYADLEGDGLNWQSFLTLGADYSIPLGTGLNVMIEHMMLAVGSSPFGDQNNSNVSAFSISYPLGIMDRLSFFSYYHWDSDIPFHFLSWQRTYDQWGIYISGYQTSEANDTPMVDEGAVAMGNQGIQLMVIFNH